MIIVGDLGVIIEPLDVKQITDKEALLFKNIFEKGGVVFSVCNDIANEIERYDNKHNLYESYKIGILKLFLERIYPNKKNSDYFKILRTTFQVYATDRKIQLRLTLFKKEQKKIFPNVSD